MSVDTSRENCELVAAKAEWDMRYTVGHVPVTLADCAALILALRDELDEAQRNAGAYRKDYLLAKDRGERVEAERDAARVDAERYRWLKANHLQTGSDSWIRTGDDLEEAIDAARGAK